MGFVVDASVCAKWLFQEEHSAVAKGLIRLGVWLGAPDLLAAEMGNIIWKRHIRGEVTAPQAVEALEIFCEVGVDLRPATEMSVEALTIAVAVRHPYYDCLYLVLAQRTGAPFVTADRRLQRAVSGTRYADLLLPIESL